MVKLEFTLEGDTEGYITFECPFCSNQFKLNASELKDDSRPHINLYCPYCGLDEEMCAFYTDEVKEQALLIAKNYAIEEINKSFGKMAKSFGNNKSIKMTYKPLKKVFIPELGEVDGTEIGVECTHCKAHHKVISHSSYSVLFCSYCGGIY